MWTVMNTFGKLHGEMVLLVENAIKINIIIV